MVVHWIEPTQLHLVEMLYDHSTSVDVQNI